MINQTSTKKSAALMTTDLFKDRKVPAPNFILNHPLFREPNPIKKVFPSVGLNNFKEECSVLTQAFDLTKPDNFAVIAIKYISAILVKAGDDVAKKVDEIQMLMSGDEQAKAIAEVRDPLCDIKAIIDGVSRQISSQNGNYTKLVQNNSGKVAIKIFQNVNNSQDKLVYKKDVSLFSILARIKDSLRLYNVPFPDYEAAKEIKSFHTENVAGKKNLVVFTAEGKDGAWDLLTMSMRGIRSCQRWDGEYPRCLIGSILSKYIGIIYLTSGAEIDNLGTKMIRRCLVRYAIDTMEKKPCILLDKMYTDTHDETVKVFIEKLQAKTKLPVYYTPNLKNSKLKYLYVPYEKIRSRVPETEWSYQDTALKTNVDLKLHILSTATNEDFNRYISLFQGKLTTLLSEKLRAASINGIEVESGIRRLAYAARMEGSLDRHSDLIIREFLSGVVQPEKKISSRDPKVLYRRYLQGVILSKKAIMANFARRISLIFPDSNFSSEDVKVIQKFVFAQVYELIKQELTTSFS